MVAGKVKVLLWFLIMISLYILFQDYTIFVFLVISIIGFIINGILVAMSPGKVKINLSCKKVMGKNEVGYCKIKAQNLSKMLIPKVRCCLEIENFTTGEILSEFIDFSLFKKSEEEIEYKISSEFCGCIVIRAKKLVYYDLFGIFSFSEDIENTAEIVVLPDAFNCNLDVSSTITENYESVTYSEVKKGKDPGETFGVRDYMEGDSINSIHWKLSSKFDKTLVKELGLPVENSILILLDTSTSARYKNNSKVIDSLMKVFLSISQSLLENQFTYTMAWYDYKLETFVNYEVKSLEELSFMISEVLKVRREKDEGSIIEKVFWEKFDEKYAHTVIITDNDLLDSLLDKDGGSELSIIRYGEEEYDSESITTFTSENMEDRLCYIRI